MGPTLGTGVQKQAVVFLCSERLEHGMGGEQGKEYVISSWLICLLIMQVPQGHREGCPRRGPLALPLMQRQS